jgi:hypothetical protein
MRTFGALDKSDFTELLHNSSVRVLVRTSSTNATGR